MCFSRSFLRDAGHHGGEEMAEGKGGKLGGGGGFGLGGLIAHASKNRRVNSKGLGSKDPCLALIPNFLQ